MDLEQQLRAALAPSKPDARVRAAVIARVSDAAKRAPGNPRGRILFGSILVALAAAAMLAAFLFKSRQPAVTASAISAEQAEPVIAVAEKPAEQAIEPVPPGLAQDVAVPEEVKPLPLLLPPKPRTAPAPPNGAMVERALVASHPELVNGPDISTVTSVSITLKADGSVYRSAISQPGQGAGIASLSDDVRALISAGGSRTTRLLQKGSAIADGAILRGTVMLTAILLPEGFDEKRTVDLVQKALLAAHPELLMPRDAETFNQVTVFMTDDGKIDKYYVKNGPQGNLRPYGDIEPARFASQWEPLGLKPEQLGLMGITNITELPAAPVAAARGGAMESLVSRLLQEARPRAAPGAADAPGASPPPRAPDPAELEAVRREVANYSANTKWMVVRYAWPRRQGEPIGGYKANVQATSLSQGGASFSHADAAAVIDHHLPGALTDTGTVAMGRPWLLMNRKGEVVRSGYLPVTGEYQRIDAAFMEKITDHRVGEVLQTTVVKKYGIAFVNSMIFAWVAPDPTRE